MANEKAPGLDCFPCEFYKVCWDFVGMDIYRVYLETLICGKFLAQLLIEVILNSSTIKEI